MGGTKGVSEPAAPCVVVVEDEPQVLRLVTQILVRAGITPRTFTSATEALAALQTYQEAPDVVLSDLNLDGMSGLQLLQAVREIWPDLAVIIMTGTATVASAVEAMRLGAYDYLVKPFDPVGAVVKTVERALERKRLLVRNEHLEREVGAIRSEGMIGDSEAFRRVFSLVDAVAPSDSSVLILGESGTGKELVARTLHNRSPRRGRSFLAINCGALAESVLDSELFGHVRGAFTGAIAGRKGLFEEASGGTIFLDEVGELPLSLQVKLLRVLQEREVRPVGSNEARHVDIRLVSATNRDLVAAVRDKTFREDLFYRLNVVSIELPPLRERKRDVPALVYHFIRKHGERLAKPVKTVDPEALELLCAYGWPGNVRELENAVERSVILSRGDTITVDVLPPTCRVSSTSAAAAPDSSTPVPLPEAMRRFERRYVEHALSKAAGNIAEAARAAGVDRSNFRRILKRHALVASSIEDER